MKLTLDQLRSIRQAVPSVTPYLSGKALWVTAQPGEMKTYEGYFNQLWNRTKELYSGVISLSDFIGELANVIQEQITRAWREALRDSASDPELVNTLYYPKVEEMILREYGFVDGFAADVIQAAQEGANVLQFRSRCELWANRYYDAYNMAMLAIREHDEQISGQSQPLMWQLGRTEEHCDICSTLNNTIAAAATWRDAHIFPQSGDTGQLPNPALVSHHFGQTGCGGWRCDCSLKDADGPVTVSTVAELRALIGY